MLGLDNPIHILMVLAVVLMLFGAKRLPEMGKGLGEGLRGFRSAISGDSASDSLTAAHEPTEPAAIGSESAVAARAATTV